jgi:uncharacterized repeat protein (TIGR02543 family)
LNYNHDAKAELKSSLLNGTLNFIEKPLREHYTFAGWYDYPVGGNKYSDESGVVSIENYTGKPAVLYAQWTGKTYTLTLNYNDGAGGTDTIDSVYPGGIALPKLPKDGYTFEGWYANADFSSGKAGTVLNAYAGSPANLYAKWKINTSATYAVTFYKNVGDSDNNVVSTTTNVAHGSNIKLPDITVPRPGYVAKGWYQERSGGGKLSGEQTITANTDFYIQWLDVNGPITPNAVGGETQYVSNLAGGFDEVHIFKDIGESTLQVLTAPEASKVSMLLVAGGGGGGGFVVFSTSSLSGCGGGAGGVLMYTDKSLAATTYPVTVGGGGTGANTNGTGGTGGDSRMSDYTAKGGGGGAYGGTFYGGDGGSGGGGMRGGSGTIGQGNKGGSIYGGDGSSDGGGYSTSKVGKGITAGSNSDLADNNMTLQNIIDGLTGVPATYAVGGKGGADSAGAANTGNGGDGGYSSGEGFAGGSGIVVVRFPYQYTEN